jgi:dephospho-CoA kinase
MSIIGITGGIGSGKSVVAQILLSMGYPVYDSDAEAKQIMQTDDAVRAQLTAAFGTDIYTHNRLNNKLLAEIAFANPLQLQNLNNIVHPAVKQHLREWAKKQKSPVLFLESAILFESGFESETDGVILVTAPLKTRINRVIQRDKCSREQVLQRMSQQWTEDAKTTKADYIVINDDYHSLITQTEEIIAQL